MSETLTPLQTIREQGFNAYMRNGMLVVGEWSKMTQEQYSYITSNVADIIGELNDEAIAAGNTDLCGYNPRYIPEVAANNHASWYIPDNMKASMGYLEPSWREGINLAHGRAKND